jgi:hypothetical protein
MLIQVRLDSLQVRGVAIYLICELCSAWRVFVGSFKGGHKVADTQTAGSVTLLMQVSLPCMLFGNIQTEVTFRFVRFLSTSRVAIGGLMLQYT